MNAGESAVAAGGAALVEPGMPERAAHTAPLISLQPTIMPCPRWSVIAGIPCKIAPRHKRSLLIMRGLTRPARRATGSAPTLPSARRKRPNPIGSASHPRAVLSSDSGAFIKAPSARSTVEPYPARSRRCIMLMAGHHEEAIRTIGGDLESTPGPQIQSCGGGRASFWSLRNSSSIATARLWESTMGSRRMA